MSQTFGDYELAAKTKEVLSTLVRKEVDKLRPPPRYATVATLDPLTVTYSGDSTPMPVKTGSVIPSAVGQIVRIEGPLGDRYVADIVTQEAGVDPYDPVVRNPDGSIDVGDGVLLPTAPVTPLNLAVTQGLEFENIYFIIDWDLVVGAVAYEVEVAEKLGANTYDLARVVSTSATTARVDGLQPYTEYGIRVTSVSNIALRSSPTAWLDVITTGDNTIPPQVSLPVLTRGATSLIVNFDPLDSLAAPDVANGNGLYEVQIDTANTFDTVNLRSYLGTSSLVAFSDLTFTATWYARVRAIDTSGNIGAWSNVASLTAGQITTDHIGDGVVSSDKIVTAGLDAAVIKFGTMSGDRITANTLDVNRLTTSTLSATTVTLGAGGQIKIGNPTTDGIFINDQGIRAYKNSSLTFIIDSAGNATFYGSLSGATGTFSGSLSSGVSITSPVITGGTITAATFKTATSGNRIEIVEGDFQSRFLKIYGTNIGGSHASDSYGYLYYGGGGLTIAKADVSCSIDITQTFSNVAQINMQVGSGQVYVSGLLYAEGGVQSQGYNVIHTNNIGSQSVYSATRATDIVSGGGMLGNWTSAVGTYNRDIASPSNRAGQFRVYCPSYIYATSSSGSTLTYNTSTGQIHYTSSTIKFKRAVQNTIDTRKVLDLQARSWYPRTDLEGDLGDNDKYHLKRKYKLTGLVAEEVHDVDPTFAIVNGRGEPIGIDWQAVTGMLLEEVKVLRNEVDALQAAMV